MSKSFKHYAFCLMPLAFIVAATAYFIYGTLRIQKELFVPVAGPICPGKGICGAKTAPPTPPSPPPPVKEKEKKEKEKEKSDAKFLNCRLDDAVKPLGYECQEAETLARVTDAAKQFHCRFAMVDEEETLYRCRNLPTPCRRVEASSENAIGVDCGPREGTVADATRPLVIPAASVVKWSQPVPKSEMTTLITDITKGYYSATFKVGLISNYGGNVSTLIFKNKTSYKFWLHVPSEFSSAPISQRVSHLLSYNSKFDNHDPSVSWNIGDDSKLEQKDGQYILKFSATPRTKDSSVQVTQLTVLINPKGKVPLVIPLNAKAFNGWDQRVTERGLVVTGDTGPSRTIMVDDQALYKITIPDRKNDGIDINYEATPSVAFVGTNNNTYDPKRFKGGVWKLKDFSLDKKTNMAVATGRISGLDSVSKITLTLPLTGSIQSNQRVGSS